MRFGKGAEASGRKGRRGLMEEACRGVKRLPGVERGRPGGGFREGKGEGRVRASGRKGKAGGFWREFARARRPFERRKRERLGAGFWGKEKIGREASGRKEGEGFWRKLAGVRNGFREGKGEC